MSFSSTVKEELSRQLTTARHCQIAEMAAILSLCGRVKISASDHFAIAIHTENLAVARKYFTLLKKTFNINTDVLIRQGLLPARSRTYVVAVREHEDALRVLQAAKLLDANGEIAEDLSLVHNVIVQNTCCRRAFIRGAFLAAGSISDPEKFYHFEITCASMGKAKQLQGLMASFGIDARIVLRKRYFVVYVKEGSQIVDLLNIMEAPVALMELENIRIVKEMRNTVNRKVNCETANINKTVSAAVKQMEDIRYICDTVGLESLPDNLKEMAKMRLERPEATLKELGEALEPPVGKSGVNHRLRKLSLIAQDIRERLAGMRRIIMVKKSIKIELSSGLEARPAAMLVQVASQYDSKIYLEADSKRVNAKSIMGMMTLGLVTGESITVEADGTDEEQAVAEIEKYLQNQ